MIEIQDDQELTAEDFNSVLAELGFRTQEQARKALGVTQAYVSYLKNGSKRVLPQTSLHKLLQALLRIHTLEHRVRELERQHSS